MYEVLHLDTIPGLEEHQIAQMAIPKKAQRDEQHHCKVTYESTNRSRLGHSGFPGLNDMNLLNRM